MILRVRIFKDASKQWRWRAKARNNRVVAVSGEGYTKKKHCRDMARKLFGVEPEEEK